MSQKSLADCRLYTFIDTAYLGGRGPEALTQQLCDGGSDLIQLRAKNSAPDEIRRMAEAILPITQRAGVRLVINDHPEIARQVGAPFCHLGQEDFFGEAPAAVPPSSMDYLPVRIGLSTHSPEQAARALQAHPDYIAIGPVYATGTKPGVPAVTLEYVRWAARHVSIPWFAIGGINLRNVDEVLQAGARRICVVSAILNAPDPVQACHEFRQHLSSAPQ